MRFLFGFLALMAAALPATAQPSPQQVQAFGGRTMSLMLAVESSRRCPGLDAMERAIAAELWKIDYASLKQLSPGVENQLPALRQLYGGKPCNDAQAIAARKNGTEYAIVVTSAVAAVIAEFPTCKPITYFENAKPWALSRKTPAALQPAVASFGAAVRGWAQANCARDTTPEPAIHTAVRADAELSELAKYGFQQCLPVGELILTHPVCAWKVPVAEGIVAGKLCNLSSGSFERKDCVFGYDAAGNLWLTYVMKTDASGKDAIDRVGFVLGGKRFDTRDAKDMGGGRRTWRFPPDAGWALLGAPGDTKIDAEAFIGDFKIDSNTPHPAADWQDAVILAQALRK